MQIKLLKLIPYVIIIGLVIALSVTQCSKQKVVLDNHEAELKEAINNEKARVIDLQNREQNLKHQLKQDSIKNKSSEISYKREIKALKFTVSELRKPVQQLIDSVPQLDAFVDAQDSVIHFQEGRIDTLTAQYYLRNLKLQGVITLTESKFEASQQINTHYQQLNESLYKQVRKERRKKTIWKIVAGTLAAGIIYQSVTQ